MNRKDILNDFNSLADKEWAKDKKHVAIINTQNQIIGVRTSDMRAMARKYAKTDLEGAIFALKNEYFEENLLHGFLLGYINDLNKCYNMLLEFLPHIDNWAVCDQTCASLKAFDKDNDGKFFDKFLALAHNEKEFYSRTGLIMLMTYYLKPECIDKIFDCLVKMNNHKFYVDMAVSWLVSVAFVKFEQKTIELLKSKKLQKRVQNKAICKIRDSFRVNLPNKELVKSFRI